MTRLSVVVPAFREAHHIATTVARLRADLAGFTSNPPASTSTGAANTPRTPPVTGQVRGLEIVVVDDGSNDGTAAIARHAGADLVLNFNENKGKGAAVRAGVLASSGQVIAFTDADLAYSPRQIQRLLVTVESGFDVVIGNRRHQQTHEVVPPKPLRYAGTRAVGVAARTLGLGGRDDTQCGLKAFSRDAAMRLFRASVVNGFAFDIEVLYLAKRCGMRVQEVPVSVINSPSSSVRVWSDGPAVLRDLLRIRVRALFGRYRKTLRASR